MAFLANEGKMTRFGDVARVADFVVAHPPKPGKQDGKPDGKPELVAKADGTKSESASPSEGATVPVPLPVGVAAPPAEPALPTPPGATAAATASP